MGQDMTGTAQTVTTVDLGYEQMLVFDGGPGARVRVLYGATWLTEEGQRTDAIVGAGSELALHGGRAVAEGLAPTRLQIVQARRSDPAAHIGRRLRQAAGWLRRQFERLQMGAGSTVEPNA